MAAWPSKSSRACGRGKKHTLMNEPVPPTSRPILASIRGPADVKSLTAPQLTQLAQEIREELIGVTSKNGGHLGPHLRGVGLTLAPHRVFDSPEDQVFFDVWHQGD